MSPLSQKHYFAIVSTCLCLVVAVLTLPIFVRAQDATPTQGTPIEISGPVTTVGTGTITVSGLTVDVSGLALTTPITTGTVITVTGVMSPTNVIVAQTIVINIVSATLTPTAAVSPTATGTLSVTATATQATPAGTASVTPAVSPTATGTLSVTPTATPSGDVIIVIEGPVINIVTNIITIYDFDIEVEPNHPILNLIQIGDLVRIEGAYGSTGIIVATVVSNLSETQLVAGASVSLEGPVESINGNIIVVNSISVQLAANDPLLQTVQVGQFVRVQGNFQNNNGVFVLVVVNVVVINVNTGGGGGNDDCWYHDDGMGMGMGMGHWHCDGMGMGMGKGSKKS